jgi:hypothetical protein
MGILLPCLITLGLCVWTAIHLNIDPARTRLRFLLFKIGWMLGGIFAPELVLFWAFCQFAEAREVRRQMHILRGKRFHKLTQPGADIVKEEEELFVQNFDMASAFFVVMGGYTVPPATGEKGLPLTLTPYGFLVLYAQGEIKDENLDKNHIQDKSKADSLAKFLVCIQALVWSTSLKLEIVVNCWSPQWLVFQCLGRLASGLPIPLLELHTVMHVLCAVAMYGFWMDKPLDVGVPISLDLKAGLAQEIYDSFEQHSFAIWQDERGPLLDTPVEQTMMSPSESTEQRPYQMPDSTIERVEIPETQAALLGSNVDRRLLDNIGTDVNTFGARWKRFWNAKHSKEDDSLRVLEIYKYWHKTFQIKLPTTPTPRKPSTIFSKLPDDLLPSVDRKTTPSKTRARMQGRSGFVTVHTTEYSQADWAYVLLVCLPLLYGGAHAAAWNTHFPSPREQLLWRLCSIAVGSMIVPFLYLCVMVDWIFDVCEKKDISGRSLVQKVKRYSFKTLEITSIVLWLTIGCGFILFYVFARVFLVVEAFLSLRSLPKGSFETVPWSNYWPHF